MKACSFLKWVTFVMAVVMMVMTGCKYDGPTAIYYHPYAQTPVPVITALTPAVATAGYNYITISGENFAAEAGNNKVYFGSTAVDVFSESTTALTVRRPNLYGDSITVKVVSYGELQTAKYGPYQIDPVLEQYGSFIENIYMSVIAVDNSENIYVVMGDAGKRIYRTTPAGVKDSVNVAANVPTDAVIGPDNKLYLLENKTAIEVMDLQTNVIHKWVTLPSGKNMKFGDFDANGYLYAGGVRNTDIYVIAPDSTYRTSGVYASVDVSAVCVYNGYLYVAGKLPTGQSPSTGIWRSSLDASGTVGPSEPVLDWTTTGDYASRTLRHMAVSADGIMYIGTDGASTSTLAADPIVSLDLATGQFDIFYKSILPSNCRHFCWGNGNYLYMICGNTSLQLPWLVYRVNMGANGGSK
jgi:hypothetical protein